MLQAAGFKTIERQLAKRGDRELKAYMPERYASLTATTSGCREVKEKVRAQWMEKLIGRKPSGVSADSPPTTESKRKQEFSVSSEGRSVNWNGEQIWLTSRRGQAMQILYDHYKSGTPDVSDEQILVELGTSNSRLRDTFRDSPLWNTLIVSKTNGMHRLDPENGFEDFLRKTRPAQNTH
jgi:hypothetical protein